MKSSTWRLRMSRVGLLHGDRWVWSNGKIIIKRRKPKKHSEKQIECPFVDHNHIKRYEDNIVHYTLFQWHTSTCSSTLYWKFLRIENAYFQNYIVPLPCCMFKINYKLVPNILINFYNSWLIFIIKQQKGMLYSSWPMIWVSYKLWSSPVRWGPCNSNFLSLLRMTLHF